MGILGILLLAILADLLFNGAKVTRWAYRTIRTNLKTK